MSSASAWYTVEAQFGTFFGQPVWVDLSPRVYLGESQTLQISRGRQDEYATIPPGRFACTLINDDGFLTPENPASPWYPWVQDGAPVRVTCRIPAPDGNYEDNPSHEFGILEWSAGGAGTAPVIDQRTYAGGNNALHIQWASQAASSLAQRRIYGLTPGQQYTASRRVFVFAGNPDVQLVMGDGGLLAVGALSTIKDAWNTVTVTFIATQQSHVLQVQTPTSPTGGFAWADSGRVEVGPSASGFTADVVGARLTDRFTGNILELPTVWGGATGLTAYTQLLAVGITNRLDARGGDLRPFDVQEPLLDGPVAFLPLDEPDGATQAGNVGSDPRAAELVNPGGGGTFQFGSGTGPPADGTSSLVLTPAGPSNGFYVRAPTSVFGSAATLEAFINSTTPGGVILNAAVPKNGDPTVGYGMSLRLAPGTGRLQWNSDGGLQVTSPTSVTDGLTHHVAAVYQHTGTQHVATLYVDGVQVASGAIGSAWVLVRADWWLVGGTSKLQLFAGTINHAGLYGQALPTDRIAAHAQAGLTGFGGERSDQRISRLAAYGGLASLTPSARPGVWQLDSSTRSILDSTTVLALTDLDSDVGQASVWGQAGGGSTVLAAMGEVTKTEGGTVTEDRSGFLAFTNRQARYNRAPTVRLDLNDGHVTADLQLAYDDQEVTNDSTMTTQDGAAVRYVDEASVAQRGTYTGDEQLLTRDPADAYSAAAWRVTRHNRPRPRYRSVAIDLGHDDPPDLVAAALSLDLGHRIDLLGLPAQAPASTAMLFAEGYTETVDDGLRLTFNTSSADGFLVWTLDNPTLSVLDTTTVLAW